jgi:hypothetical protein
MENWRRPGELPNVANAADQHLTTLDATTNPLQEFINRRI